MKNSARKTQSEKAASKSKELQQKKKTESEPKEVLYQVKTKRTSDVIKAYITFTYRVFHPKVTARMVLYGLLIFVPGFFVKAQALKIVLWVTGALVVLLGLFRQYISLALTKKSDEDYRNGSEFEYEFTQNDASFFCNGEYYLSLKSRELFILPIDGFTIGDPSTFGDFMYKRCKKICRWIPVKFSNRIKKMRSQRAIARGQMNKRS